MTQTDETWEQLEAARARAELYDARAVSAAWLDAQVFPALEWTVEGVLPEGLGLLAAPPKCGKSWMVANIGLACAAGGYALGAIPVKQRPVLYVALEDGHRRLQARLRTLMEGAALPGQLEIVTKATPAEALHIIDEYLRRHHGDAPLVIVDTYAKMKPPRPPSEDPYAYDYRIGGALKARVDSVTGACLLLVHHTRKAETVDFLDAVSGTNAVAGSADFILVLRRKRHADDATLSVTGRDVHEAEYALTASGGRWRLDGGDLAEAATNATKRRDTADLGDRSREALAFVEAHPAGVGAEGLADHLGVQPDVAGRYLRRLHAAERINRPARGIYTPVSETFGVSEPDEPADQPYQPEHHQTDTPSASDTLPGTKEEP